MAENVSGHERISAQREEVIVNTNLLDLKNHCPVLCQHLLKWRPRRDEGPRKCHASRETQLGRQADTLHFAGRAFRDFLYDEHLARDLEVGDAAAGELTYVFRRRHSVRPQHDRRGDIFTQRGVGDRKGHGVCHRWMFQEHFVDFLGGDFLATAIDHLPYAAREKQVPIVIEETKISCLEPVACKRGFGRHWVAVIAVDDARAPDDDLASLAAGQQSPGFVHDCDVQTHWDADRAGLALARR